MDRAWAVGAPVRTRSVMCDHGRARRTQTRTKMTEKALTSLRGQVWGTRPTCVSKSPRINTDITLERGTVTQELRA